MEILKSIEEETLKILLEHYDGNKENCINVRYEWFPKYIEVAINDIIDNLKIVGIISQEIFVCGSFGVFLTPNGINYFKDKEEYLKEMDEEKKKSKSQNIITINADRSNVVVGDVTNSTLSIDNSIHEIEKIIDEKGGEDKEKLLEVLDEVKELIQNIKASRQVPNNKGFVKRLTAHLDNHGWFYAQIVALLGKSVLGLL